jgi:hypothetical protein
MHACLAGCHLAFAGDGRAPARRRVFRRPLWKRLGGPAGTALAPWRTLQHAADEAGPGDRVRVRAGNYVGFDLRHSGSLNAPIEFSAELGVLIDRPSRVRQRDGEFLDGINLEGASHIVIDGFNIAGMPEAGVRSVGFDNDFASHVTVRNITATGNGVWGIFTGHVDDLLIEDNRTSGSLDEHGIYVSNSGDRPIIQRNVIWGNHGSGIHMNGDLSQGGDGIISSALVSGNIIYDNGTTGSGINMDGVQNSVIENNLIFDNHSSGISLYQIDAAEPASNNLVINNTIHIAENGRWALNVQDESIGNKALNNILISDHSFRGAIDVCGGCRPGFVSDYNVVIPRFTSGGSNYNSLAQWRAATGNDTHSLAAPAASALFVDPASGDYHLLATSAARDVGTATLAAMFDLDGKSRPIGAGFDIGAYEYGTVTVDGDFNEDGTVDAADYTVWRNGLGTIYTQADYELWKTHFGQTAGSGDNRAAAPEPASPILATLGLAWLAGKRRHRRSGARSTQTSSFSPRK